MPFHGFEGDLDGLDEALRVKFHPVNAGYPVVAILFAQGAAVIDDEIGIFAGNLDD
jgi:hypothetical protein